MMTFQHVVIHDIDEKNVEKAQISMNMQRKERKFEK